MRNMSGILVRLFEGTMVGTDSYYSQPVDVTSVTALTLRVRYISGIGTSPEITAELETSNNPEAEDADWETTGASLTASSGSPIQHDTSIVSSGSGVDNFMGYVRAKVTTGGDTGNTDNAVLGYVEVLGRSK